MFDQVDANKSPLVGIQVINQNFADLGQVIYELSSTQRIHDKQMFQYLFITGFGI